MPQTILMSMRWVLTWKPSDEHPPGGKAKARMVVLGNQHPEVAERTMANSTLSRLGKMLTLQWTAPNHAELERADAMSAMLQGDGKEMQKSEDVYARALNEFACLMNTPLGSAVKHAKAEFKLGNAPQSWWLSVDRFLTSMAGEKGTEHLDGSDGLVSFSRRSRCHVRSGSRLRGRNPHHWHCWKDV